MLTLEKLTMSITLLMVLLAGLYESDEISLKAFLILGAALLFLLFKIVRKVDQMQQKIDQNSDDER